MVGANNGACDKLGEKGGVETKVENIGRMADLALVYIHYITNILECEKRDAHRKRDDINIEARLGGEMVGKLGKMVHNMQVAMEHVVVNIGEEVSVFEIEQDGEIDNYAENQEAFAAHVALSGIMVGKTVETDTQQISENRGENKQQNKQSAGLIVKEKADNEEVSIAERKFGEGTVTCYILLSQKGGEETQSGKDNEEESPEIELGEQQGICLVVDYQVTQKRN